MVTISIRILSSVPRFFHTSVTPLQMDFIELQQSRPSRAVRTLSVINPGSIFHLQQGFTCNFLEPQNVFSQIAALFKNLCNLLFRPTTSLLPSIQLHCRVRFLSLLLCMALSEQAGGGDGDFGQ